MTQRRDAPLDELSDQLCSILLAAEMLEKKLRARDDDLAKLATIVVHGARRMVETMSSLDGDGDGDGDATSKSRGSRSKS